MGVESGLSLDSNLDHRSQSNELLISLPSAGILDRINADLSSINSVKLILMLFLKKRKLSLLFLMLKRWEPCYL